MTTAIIQPSFAAGELSPFLYGRVDLAKFHVGARTMLNMFVHPHGGASNRPGTRFIGEVDDSNKRHRLIDFKFRASPGGQNYVLVFGDFTMQVVMFNGTSWGFVETAPGSGVRFTLATPYALADLPTLKYLQSADTMTLTHPSYAPRKLTRTGHATWQLNTITFAPNTPSPTGLASTTPGGGPSIVVSAINDSNGEESLPSSSAQGAGSSDTWNWTAVAGCTNYNIYKKSGSIFGFVAQAATNSWTDANLAPDIGNTPPTQRNPFGANKITAVTVSNGGSGYVGPTLRAVDTAGSGATFTVHISGGAITSVDVNGQGQNYSPNTTLQVSDGGGSGANLQLNFVDDGTDGVHYKIDSVTVLAGGSAYHAGAYAIVVQPGGTNNGAALSLTVAAGAIISCAVVNPGFGFNPTFPFPYAQVYDASGTGAVLTPTLTADPATYPGCSTYYMQRQAFGGTLASPQTLWFSVTGAFNNMSVSQPTKDDDAITRALTSRQVNEIRHLVPGVSLLVMTSGAEWRCWPGPSATAITPGTCVTLPQSAYGCSHVPPIQAGQSVLFVQERGSRVRELRFDLLQDQYQATDMSVLSQHLLSDTSAQYQIQEWAFAEEPFRVIWCVRSDGALLGFTFMREHEVYAWHRHTTDGRVESVCSIPEPDGQGGYVDAVYLIVKRTIGGQIKRYVERMVERVFPTIADAWFVDCALQYVAANTAPIETVTIRANGFDNSYDAGATLLSVILSNAGAILTQDSVGSIVTARSGADSVQVLLTEVVDGSDAYGTLLQDCPASLRNIATSDWTLPGVTTVTSISGLGHLEGKTVSILGDGSVVPNQVVMGGAVALDGPYSKVTVGLPYTADLVTLDLELPSQSGTVQGQPKKIAQATIRVKDARGIQAGIEQEVPPGAFGGAASGAPALVEVKQRSMETLGSPMQPYSGDWQVTIPTEWNRGGRLFIRQSYPLPCTVLAIVPEVSVGD